MAILHEGGEMSLSEARAGTAGEKENGLRRLLKRLRAEQAPQGTLDALDEAIRAFAEIRSEKRNVVSHAHPFTSSHDADGTYRPGLMYTDNEGRERRVADGPEDLLKIARDAEEAIGPLSQARKRVREFHRGVER
ncbi:MAG: hypothetical protein WBQ41_04485 [Solirubrobacterales bacterium]